MKIIAVLLMTGALVSATPTIANVQLVNAGAPTVSDGSYYVGPYEVSIDGKSTAALCVDFRHESSVGNTWNAYVSSLTGSLANTYNPGSKTQYAKEAYLYSLITKTGTSDANRIDIQHAAWNITDSDYQINSSAEAFVNLAAKNYGSVNLSSFQLLSSVDCADREQEFLVAGAAAPEPGSMMLMGAGFLGAAMISCRLRRA